MTGHLYLSQAMDMNDIESGRMNIICAPTGCGKSYFALNGLNKLASVNGRYLYVIDTINGREQLLRKNNNTAPYGRSWEEYIQNGKPDFVIGEWEIFDDSKIVVITYAAFGSLVKRIPNFGYNFDVIVCDEIHSGVEMKSYNKDKTKYNYALNAIKRIKDIIAHSQVKVIALTATPSRAEEFFKGMTKYIPIHEDIRRYETFNTILYTNLDYMLHSLNIAHKGIIYTSHITDTNGMIEIWEKVTQRGIKAIAVWSTGNKDHLMTDEQLKARDYILEKEGLPPSYDVLIINKSLETGINIKEENGKLDYILVHRQEEDVQIQARGRYRGDLQTQYIYSHDAPLIVPDEYIGRRLFKEDTKKLCALLMARNGNDNLVGWTTTKNILRKQGYTILEGDKYRQNNKRYCIIMPKNNVSLNIEA